MRYGDGMINGWGMMHPFMWIFMLLFWGILIFGVIFFIRWLIDRGKSNDQKSLPETPLEILNRRYANGEIGKDEYEQMKKDLK